MREEYKRKGAIHGPYQLVEFESEEIILDIPPEGTSSNGWKIIPLVPPVVRFCQTKFKIFHAILLFIVEKDPG